MADFYMAPNSTQPTLVDRLYANGEPVDLTEADSVHLIVTKHGEEYVNRAGTIDTPKVNGVVRFAWSTSDFPETGVYEARWKVVWSDDTVQYYPNRPKHIEVT